jgi:hypothetical protein
MFSAIRSRITYANVVATIALLLAMGGTAAAAKHYLVNSTKQINPKVLRALKGEDGQNGAKGATGVAGPAGPAGAAGVPGPAGKEGASATKLWAVVSFNGTLVRGSGVTGVVHEGTGQYNVYFNRSLEQCAFEATIGSPGFEFMEHGIADVAGAAESQPLDNAVFVDTFEFNGTSANRGFHLAVFC